MCVVSRINMRGIGLDMRRGKRTKGDFRDSAAKIIHARMFTYILFVCVPATVWRERESFLRAIHGACKQVVGVETGDANKKPSCPAKPTEKERESEIDRELAKEEVQMRRVLGSKDFPNLCALTTRALPNAAADAAAAATK